MPRRRESRPPAALELKSTRLTGILVLLHSADSAALEAHLETLFSSADAFFGGEVAVFDCARLAADSAAPDWVWLAAALKRQGLFPYAVRNASGGLADAARSAGLVVLNDVEPPTRHTMADTAESATTASTVAATTTASASPTPDQTELDLPEPVAAAPDAAEPVRTAVAPTRIVDKPLRSGQRIYAQGGDLVVLAVVNPGAEVIADGSIHIYAPLKGRALAGARGDASARIFTSRFEAELVSIAGVYRTFDAAPDPAVHLRPAQIRLLTDSNQLDVTPL